MKTILPLCLALCLIFAAACNTTDQTNSSAFEIKVDPRIELLSILLNYSDWPYFGKFDDTTYGYYRDVREHFDSFKDHPAVAWFNQASENWNLDDPATVMLWLSPPPDMKLVNPFPLHPTSKMDTSDVKALAEMLNRFAKDTDFESFWQSHQSFYHDYVNTIKDVVPFDSLINIMTAFYNEDKSHFVYIVAPLFNRVSFGPQLVTDEGVIPHFISGPHSIVDGRPTASAKTMRMLIFHEFGHSFVNPVCESYRQQIMANSNFFGYMKDDMSAIAYPDWFPTFHEHVVRAGESILLERAGYITEARENYKRNFRLGFALLPFITQKLEYYGDHHDQYPSFRDYFPELLKIFDEIKPVPARVPAKLGAALRMRGDYCVALRITDSSAIADAGLQAGDTIRAFNDTTLTTESDLYRLNDSWYDCSEGHVIALTVRRDGRDTTITCEVPFVEKTRFVDLNKD